MSAVLYNCRPGNQAPDWSQFSHIEVNGVCNVADDEAKARGETLYEACDDDQAEIWTVYGRLREGGADAITDCDTRGKAQTVAELFECWVKP